MSREAMQLALDALEHGGPAYRTRALHALRAALAEPVQSEPVGTVRDCVWSGSAWSVTILAPTQLRLGAKLYAGPPQPKASAEPVQAVALYKVTVTGRLHETEPTAAAFDLPDGEHLLYAATPQPREPVRLTDEQIVDMAREADLDWQRGWALEGDQNRYEAFARAVESAVLRAQGIET